MVAALEEDKKKKQSIFQKIFDDNTFFNYLNKVEKPTLSSEYPWFTRWWHQYPGQFRAKDPLVNPVTSESYFYSGFKQGPALMESPLNDHLLQFHDMATSGCWDVEKNALECLEYYGGKRGAVICRDYYDDYMECTRQFKQKLRADAMMRTRNGRYYEWLAGKRDYDTVYIPMNKPGVYRDPCASPKDLMGEDYMA